MIINGFIKDNVLDLSFGLAYYIPKIIIEKEKELKFYVIVFHELSIIIPYHVFLWSYFSDFSESLRWNSIPHHNKTLTIEYLQVLLLGSYLDYQLSYLNIIDSHQEVCQRIIDHKVLDILAGSWSFDLSFLFLFYCLK